MVQCCSKTKLLWLSNPPEIAKILHRDIFWFFLKDEEFVSKAINDSNIDLDRFLASKVRQLAEKMESSKATARHIKKVASDPQGAQINLKWHQHTDLPASKHNKGRSFVRLRPPSYKHDASNRPPVPSYHNNTNKKSFDVKHVYKYKERCQKCGDSLHADGFQCPAKKYQCKSCHMWGHVTSLWYQKKQVSFRPRKPKAHMSQVWAVYACDKSICSHPEDLSSSDESFCLQVKIPYTSADCKKIPTQYHLITNLAYRLQPHHMRNQYQRARLDILNRCKYNAS